MKMVTLTLGPKGNISHPAARTPGAQGQNPAAEPKDGGDAANQIVSQGDKGDDECYQEERRIKEGEEVVRLEDLH